METTSERRLREIVFAKADDAEDYLSRIADSIGSVEFERDGFHMSYAGGRIGACALHRGATSAMRYRVSRSGELHFLLLQRGTASFRGDRRAGEALANRQGLLLGPSSAGRCTVAADSAGISLITTQAAMRTFASGLVGGDRAIDIAPADVTALDLGDPVAASLARNVAAVFHELRALGRAGLSRVAAASFDELLLGLAVLAASPKLREAVRDVRPEAGSAAVRQAREYLHAHAAEPVSLSALAARIGIGLRSLQLAFRRELGCSPREYLLACRLELARARLLAAEEGGTVTQIALDCGFTDMAVFARRYREQFGERPSDTLKRR